MFSTIIPHDRSAGQASLKCWPSRHLSSTAGPRRSFSLTVATIALCLLSSAATALAIPSQPHHDLLAGDDEEAILYDNDAVDFVRRQSSSTSGSNSLPQPFDTSLGNNFTSDGCLPFFNSFLNDNNFMACSPLSLLLQTSSGFFAAQNVPSLLNATLNAGCAVNVTECSQLMSSLNSQLQETNNCGPDYQRENPTVLQAAAGFAAYDVLYQATCLRDPSNGKYCFAEAAQNASSPSNIYAYYLPLGLKLPTNASPTCNTCLRKTMTIYAESAIESGSALAQDYLPAAQTLDTRCGSGFAQLDVKVGSAATRRAYPGTVYICLIAAALMLFGLV